MGDHREMRDLGMTVILRNTMNTDLLSASRQRREAEKCSANINK